MCIFPFFCLIFFHWPCDDRIKWHTWIQQQRIPTTWMILFVRSRERVRASCIVYRNLFIHFINYQMPNWTIHKTNDVLGVIVSERAIGTGFLARDCSFLTHLLCFWMESLNIFKSQIKETLTHSHTQASIQTNPAFSIFSHCLYFEIWHDNQICTQ